MQKSNLSMKKFAVGMLAAAMTFTACNVNVFAATNKISLTSSVPSKVIDIKGKTTINTGEVAEAKFTSKNPKIAVVNQDGVVTGKKAGTVSIEVSAKGYQTSRISIKVKNLMPKKITASGVSLQAGQKVKIKVSVSPAGVYAPLKYISKNPAVAKVSKSGAVTGVKSGNTTVTITSSEVKSVKANAAITVRSAYSSAKATEDQVNSYMNDKDENTVLVDARAAEAYSGYAIDGVKYGGHLKNAKLYSARWLTCNYFLETPRATYLNRDLKENDMTKSKSYIIYDTNGKDANAVAKYLYGRGYDHVKIYNASELINSGKDLEKESGYQMMVPAQIVKNVSDHIVNGAALSDEAKSIVGTSKKVVILDVGWGNYKESTYTTGHVPGAIHVNSDEYERPHVYVPEKRSEYAKEWRMADPDTLREVVRRKGIDKDTCVLITGNTQGSVTGCPEARFAHVLKYVGIKNVHVMNGTLTSVWEYYNYPEETKINVPERVDSLGTDELNDDVWVNMDQAKEISEDKTGSKGVLVDQRDSKSHNGLYSGYSYHDLAGYIPGSKYIPNETDQCGYIFQNADLTVRPGSLIRSYLTKQGLDLSKLSAWYCGDSWGAAKDAWFCQAAGINTVKMYTQGWIAWSNEGNDFIDHKGRVVHYDKNKDAVIDENGKDVSDGINIRGVVAGM
jgi:3-mercaptopyruvate sulfurtransferase SseA